MTIDLLTPPEVAALLRKSKSWVYAACERGEIRSKRVGRDLRVERADLHLYLEAQTQKPSHPTLKEEE